MTIDSLSGSGSDRNQATSGVGSTQNELRPVQGSETGSRAVERLSAAGGATGYKQAASVFREAAAQLQEVMRLVNSNLSISIDDQLGETVVKVVNRDNDEVIRQIPNEDLLTLMRRLSDIGKQYSSEASGILLEDEA